jgi:anti-sigma regulatory factor (Ser/Thr protein kinase)
MSQPQVLTLTNHLSELARLATWLEDFAQEHGIDKKTMMRVNLALDELVTNVISYAWTDGQDHEFRLELRLSGDRLHAELIDDGVPFNPLRTPPPDLTTDADERPIGGLGIHFVRETMDEVAYHLEQGQNHLRLMKRLGG